MCKHPQQALVIEDISMDVLMESQVPIISAVGRLVLQHNGFDIEALVEVTCLACGEKFTKTALVLL